MKKQICYPIFILITLLFIGKLNGQNLFSQKEKWILKSNLPLYAREDAVGFSIGKNGYIGTGQIYGDGINEKTNDFWEYDIEKNEWNQKEALGGASRNCAVGFSIGSKGYIGTGFNDMRQPLKDFWQFDIASNSWTQIADFEGVSRLGAIGFSIGEKGFVGTGKDSQGYKNDIWEYEPKSNHWTKKANFGGEGRESSVAFSIGRKGYVMLGNNSVYQNDVWEYDATSDHWSRKNDFPGGKRTRCIGVAIGNQNAIVGTGFNGNALSDFWLYDAVSDKWRKIVPDNPPKRQQAVCFSIGNAFFYGGGNKYNESLDDFWELSFESVQKTTTEITYNQEFKIGSAIATCQTKYGSNFKQAIQYGEEGAEIKIYQLWNSEKLLLEVTPNAENEKVVGEIRIFDPSYKNSKGIGVGTSLIDFLKMYPDMKIGYTYISGRFIVSSNQEKMTQFDIDPKDYISGNEKLSGGDWIDLFEKDFVQNVKIKSVRIF